MEWETLLSTTKLAAEELEPEQFSRYPINDFEKDYHKIVSSAVFRRLQDKTQAFPLDRSDFVRTRLTHSIEVSTIARQLGIMISQNTTPYRPSDIDAEKGENIASVLMCAGLLHDLGNPPFGHFGESTIGEWFQNHLGTLQYKGRSLREVLSPQMVKDLENFEGNAQALRILCKAQYGSEINLSAAVMATLVKYPADSLAFDPEDENVKKHKAGYYLAEKSALLRISETVGTLRENGEICRHPLTFFLEAADDIAYSTADLEDAFEKKLFVLDDFVGFFEAHCGEAPERTPAHYSKLLIEDLKARRGEAHHPARDSKAFKDWLVHARRWLMYMAVYGFSSNYSDIMEGNYTKDLFHNTNHSATMQILKASMRRFLYNAPGILKLELSAQTILSFLLDKFVAAVLYHDYGHEEFQPTKADKKYLRLFPDSYKEHYAAARTGNEEMDLYLRLLMVTDYISGMTDSYVRTLYRELSGIE